MNGTNTLITSTKELRNAKDILERWEIYNNRVFDYYVKPKKISERELADTIDNLIKLIENRT